MKNLLHKFKPLLFSHFKKSVEKTEDTNSVKLEMFTPKDFVSGFIAIPEGVNPLEAAWHAAANALETERVRFVHQIADGGIYFIASDAMDFASHPDSATSLAAALPGATGHEGDGAYLLEIGGGSVAVVIKGKCSLKSYAGERNNVMRFIDGCENRFWPMNGMRWVGYSEYENQHARRIAKITITSCAGISVLFFALAISFLIATEVITHNKTNAINKIRAEQEKIAAGFNDQSTSDAYTEYMKTAKAVLDTDGRMISFDSNGKVTKFELNLPNGANTELLGMEVSIKPAGKRILVSK